MALKSRKYGPSEFVLASERLPPVCLWWAVHTLFVPGNRGLIDTVALQGVHEAVQWKVDMRNAKGEDIGSLSKATCQVAGCLAACRVVGEVRPADGATQIVDAHHNLSEPDFDVCLRPPLPKEPNEAPPSE